MSKATYRRGGRKAARIRQILSYVTRPELDNTIDHYTARELECLTGYYIQQTALSELGPKLGINPSTVSRNIHRGEEKLWQVIELADKISPFRLPEIMKEE